MCMPTLHELQSNFVQFLVGEASSDVVETVDAGGADPVSLLSIYRNNMLITLMDTLAVTFPVVRRLVDPRFFEYASQTFISGNLPSKPCLAEYGSEFPSFLALFPPAAEVPYLSDVASLEWAISRVMRSEIEPEISLDSIVNIETDPAKIRLRIGTSVRYLASVYPIHQIWLANRSDIEPAEMHLSRKREHLQIRQTDSLELQCLPPAVWLFRALIADGGELGAAAEAAFELDPMFKLPVALASMFNDGIVVGLAA
jgi:Putative DNA-binding domain